MSTENDASPLRILHLEDEVKDAMLVEAALQVDGLECVLLHVNCEAELTAALERESFDLILSDFALPGFNGLAALQCARRLAPDVPFVFVSGTLGEETALAAVRNGATDYVLKHRLTHLGPAIRRAVEEARERQRLRETEQALRRSEEQFRQAQKMEAVGRLAAGVAHDFNNMLTAILGYAAIAKSKLDPAHMAVSDLDEVSKAGERAARLTRQLLAFSRQQALQPRALDLNTVVLELSQMLRRLIGDDIEFQTVQARDLGPIFADPGQIEQILLNLVVNARDAMPGGGKLMIETSEVVLDEARARGGLDLPPGPYVRLAVRDDGVGMDAEVQARMFEPFFTTKEPGKGTGLGLSTVFGIVKQSGGSVEVHSEPGKGATFELYFPRVVAEIDSAAAAQKKSSSANGLETVLLVEDDDAVRGLVSQTLALHGFRMHLARDGREALRILEQGSVTPDLLITDLIMPGLGGAELIAQAAVLRPEMKVLCISGYAEGAVLHQAVNVDGVPFLQKPFTPHALAQKVRSVLDSERRRAA